MADNYEIQLQNAEKRFLSYDCMAMARRLGLPCDAEAIYIDFLGRRCRIDKLSGRITYSDSGERLAFRAAMSIYDYICRSTPLPSFGGRKLPINSLQKSHPGVGEAGYYERYTVKFDENRETFAAACRAMGGTAYPRGDAAFTFTVFDGLELTVQLWYSDEEFDAKLALLWDEQVLNALMYESAWYVCGYLLNEILEKMKQ